ncbi:MAG: DUF5041 domain-containing protein [Rikenellaceae bacterium]|jgi:hypothetical protein|nr:DUF5041 domain-containing protein [Rikenellaceae bacterium]
MKNRIAAIILTILATALCAAGQEYRKDKRPQADKRDGLGMYQAEKVDMLHLLGALEIAGIRIFNFPLEPFDKKYRMEIRVHEYVDGKEVEQGAANSFDCFQDNTYIHPDMEDTGRYYTDYIESLTFYTKEADSTSKIRCDTYTMRVYASLRKKTIRAGSFYQWRSYGKTDWKQGEEIPLLVYASSWWDDKYKIERFCGVVDLSRDEARTRELLDMSPHYFVITYKIFE